MLSAVRLAAIHEAAHVVAAIHTGCEIGLVAVTLEGGGTARFRRLRRDVRPLDDPLLRHLAGAAGEAHALGFGDLSFREIAWRCGPAAVDFQRARRSFRIGADVYLERVWRRAVALVRSRWNDVERLAAALEAEGRLDGPRAAQLAGWKRR